MGFLAAIPAAIGTVMTASTATAAELAAATATLTAAAAATAVVSAGVTGYSQYQQHSFQAKVAANNEQIAANNKASSLEQGQALESASRMDTTRKIGAALAAQGANGIDVNFGSASRVRSGIKDIGELDALTIRHNAVLQAMGYENQGGQFGAESKLQSQAATMAAVSGVVDAGSSLLSGATATSKLALQRVTGQVGASAPKG